MINLAFWFGMVTCFLAGLKLTIFPDLQFHPIGVILLTVVAFFVDHTNKPTTFLFLGESKYDNTKQSD